MSIRDCIAKLRPGDPPLIVGYRHEADYVMLLAQQTGHRLIRQKEGSMFTLRCIGISNGSALAWLRRLRVHRKAKRRWRDKYPEKYRLQEERRRLRRKFKEAGVADTG